MKKALSKQLRIEKTHEKIVGSHNQRTIQISKIDKSFLTSQDALDIVNKYSKELLLKHPDAQYLVRIQTKTNFRTIKSLEQDLPQDAEYFQDYYVNKVQDPTKAGEIFCIQVTTLFEK